MNDLIYAAVFTLLVVGVGVGVGLLSWKLWCK